MVEVKYVIHDYAGQHGIDHEAVVSGNIADLVLVYQDRQAEVGITILEIIDKGTK
jgi:hypothetical protein